MSDMGRAHDGAKAKFARDLMMAELKYRRDKMWKLFSWVNTLLTGVTGGVIALKTQPDKHFNLTPVYKVALIIAVLGLAAHGAVWLEYNWRRTRKIWGSLKKYSGNSEIELLDFGKSPVRYSHAVAALGLAAAIAILF